MEKTSFIVRRMSEDDFDSVIRLAATQSSFSSLTHYILWMNLRNFPELSLVVQSNNGTVCGYMLGVIKGSLIKEFFIWQLLVAKDALCSGAGDHLIIKLRDVVNDLNANIITFTAISKSRALNWICSKAKQYLNAAPVEVVELPEVIYPKECLYEIKLLSKEEKNLSI